MTSQIQDGKPVLHILGIFVQYMKTGLTEVKNYRLGIRDICRKRICDKKK